MSTIRRSIKKALLVVLILGLIPAAIVLFYLGLLFAAHGFSRDFLEIDTCLDSGGAWDYTNRWCLH